MEFSQKELNDLIEERNRLAHENEILYKKIEDLENKKCSDLKKYISILEERLSNNSNNPKDDCNDLKQKIKRLHDELKVLYENEERYEKIFNQQKANMEKWKNKYEKTEIQLKEKIAENEQLKLEIEGLKLEIKNLKKEDGWEEKYKSLRTSFDILLNEYEGATKSIKALKEELAEQENWKNKYLALTKNKNNTSYKINEDAVGLIIETIEMILDKEYDKAIRLLLSIIKEARKKK